LRRIHPHLQGHLVGFATQVREQVANRMLAGIDPRSVGSLVHRLHHSAENLMHPPLHAPGKHLGRNLHNAADCLTIHGLILRAAPQPK